MKASFLNGMTPNARSPRRTIDKGVGRFEGEMMMNFNTIFYLRQKKQYQILVYCSSAVSIKGEPLIIYICYSFERSKVIKLPLHVQVFDSIRSWKVPEKEELDSNDKLETQISGQGWEHGQLYAFFYNTICDQVG